MGLDVTTVNQGMQHSVILKVMDYTIETYQDEPYVIHIDNPFALVCHSDHCQYDPLEEGHQMGQASLKPVSTSIIFAALEPYLTVGGRDASDPMSFLHPQRRSSSQGWHFATSLHCQGSPWRMMDGDGELWVKIPLGYTW